MNKKIAWTDIALLILSLILCFGTAFVFTACDMKDDETWMRCHWAQVAVVGLGAVMVFLNITRFFLDRKIRLGIDISCIAISVLAALTPHTIIPLCMINTMHCRSIMQPSVIIASAITGIVALFDLLLSTRNKAVNIK